MATITVVGEDSVFGKAVELITMYVAPVALQAAVKLHVPDILASVSEELSPLEIIALMKSQYHLLVPNPTAHIPLDRLLRLLASHGFFSSSLHEQPDGQLPVRKYGSTPLSRCFSGDGSLRSFSLMTQVKEITQSWPLLDRAVLDGTDAFTLAHGQPLYGMFLNNPHFAHTFNSGMASFSKLFMSLFLSSYDGFHNVNTLVDVGGGSGACISAIISRYPHIKGINFDRPHVLASFPSHPRVENVEGDMFKSIPQADAIFIKHILHNYPDELCVEILKNCYKALLKNGKVIVVDIILPSSVETTIISRVQSICDLAMLSNFKGGMERTQQELQNIATSAGFKRFHRVIDVYDTAIVELRKD